MLRSKFGLVECLPRLLTGEWVAANDAGTTVFARVARAAVARIGIERVGWILSADDCAVSKPLEQADVRGEREEREEREKRMPAR